MKKLKKYKPGGSNKGSGSEESVPSSTNTGSSGVYSDYLNRFRDLSAEKGRVSKVRESVIDTAANKAERNIPAQTNVAGFYCNTHNCEVYREAGATVPEDIKINGRIYHSGDKMPVIPGNSQFVSLASKLGFQRVNESPQPGDLTFMVGDYIEYSPETGQYTTIRRPHHSLIESGQVGSHGYPLYYHAPGGKKDKYNLSESYYPDNEYQSYRYVGQVPVIENDLERMYEEVQRTPVPFERSGPVMIPRMNDGGSAGCEDCNQDMYNEILKQTSKSKIAPQNTDTDLISSALKDSYRRSIKKNMMNAIIAEEILNIGDAIVGDNVEMQKDYLEPVKKKIGGALDKRPMFFRGGGYSGNFNQDAFINRISELDKSRNLNSGYLTNSLSSVIQAEIDPTEYIKSRKTVFTNPADQEKYEQLKSRYKATGETGFINAYESGGGVKRRKYDVNAISPRVGFRDNGDGTKSTHKMAYAESDGKYYAYPTLFQDDQGQWYEVSDDNFEALEEARRKGEIFEFDKEKDARKFAGGSWKKELKNAENGYNFTSNDIYSRASKVLRSNRGRYSPYRLENFGESNNPNSEESKTYSGPPRVMYDLSSTRLDDVSVKPRLIGKRPREVSYTFGHYASDMNKREFAVPVSLQRSDFELLKRQGFDLSNVDGRIAPPVGLQEEESVVMPPYETQRYADFIQFLPEKKKGGGLKKMRIGGEDDPYLPVQLKGIEPPSPVIIPRDMYYKPNPLNSGQQYPFEAEAKKQPIANTYVTKGYQGASAFDKVELAMAGVKGIESIANSFERKKLEEQLMSRLTADAINPVIPAGSVSRGDWSVNDGYFRPADHVPVQFKGINTGSPNGGLPFNKGGEVSVREKALALLNKGGVVKIKR